MSFMSYDYNINHLLDSLVVHPIRASERTEWDRLMSKHHYLGFKSLVGESIRYVAELVLDSYRLFPVEVSIYRGFSL